jgi:hypothetical protein
MPAIVMVLCSCRLSSPVGLGDEVNGCDSNGSGVENNPHCMFETQSILSFSKVGALLGDSYREGLGHGLAIGPVGNDGSDKLIVSAPWAGSLGANGRVDIYSADTYELLYSVEGTQDHELFGHSVAFAGDFNGDGYGDFAVHSWKQGIQIISGKDQSVIFANREGCLGINSSIAYGDFNGDGRSDIAAGDPCSIPGRIKIYSGIDKSLLFSVDGPNEDDEFGFHMAAAGDLNGDGSDEIVVVNRLGSKAIVYSPKTNSELFTLSHPDLWSGLNVSGGEDFNGDGKNDIALGAVAGGFAVFSGVDGSIIFKGEKNGSNSRVQFIGDFDADGLSDLAVRRDGFMEIYSGQNNSLIDRIYYEEDTWNLGNVMAGKSHFNGGATGALFFPADIYIVKDENGHQVGGEGSSKVYLYTPGP